MQRWEARLWHLLSKARGDAGEDDCWEWTEHVDEPTGYGKYYNRYAHHYVYVIVTGEDVDGYHIHHKCHNKLCVNPKHLQKVTASVHQRIHPGKRKKPWNYRPAR